MKLDNLHQELLKQIQQQLEIFLDITSPSTILVEAMRYSTLNGGKRIRPLLVIAGGMVSGSSDIQSLVKIGCIFELIHCYSLIHDDLPAMDNDDLRRGVPTCHKKFNEAIAILAGDALQSLAVELICSDFLPLTPPLKLALVSLCTKASGVAGMVGGQSLDITSTATTTSFEQLQVMHELKTGKLIQATLLAGCIGAGITNGKLYTTLSNIGYKVGLLFQIIDDIIDLTSTTDKLGKTANKDQNFQKCTYATTIGIDESINLSKNLYREIIDIVKQIDNSDFLSYLIELIYNRDN